MCILCTALPATLSVGVVAEAKQREARRSAQARGETPAQLRPYGLLSLAAVAVLIAIATFYHARGGA